MPVSDRPVDDSPWTPREAELLAVTLQLLQENGYDRLTLEAVATTAQASKATMYRRWPSKAELVLAAFIEGVRQNVVAPDTGTLRGDLLRLGQSILDQCGRHSATMRAVLVEVSNNPALSEAMQTQFIDKRRALMHYVLQQAVDRGEIEAAAVSHELWDVLPGYLTFRSLLPSTPATPHTVQVLVDEVLIPSLTRSTS